MADEKKTAQQKEAQDEELKQDDLESVAGGCFCPDIGIWPPKTTFPPIPIPIDTLPATDPYI